MRCLLLPVLALTTACSTAVQTTRTEVADPAALAISAFWTGVGWVTFIIVVGLVMISRAIAYAISERAKYQLDRKERRDRGETS